MQHAKQSAWPYIMKTAYVVQMNEYKYVGGKPREAVCIIICLSNYPNQNCRKSRKERKLSNDCFKYTSSGHLFA